MINTPIIEFDYAETREATFMPWIDVEHIDLKSNAFVKRGYYYTRADHHGLFVGYAELKDFDQYISSFPIDQFLIVIEGKIEITDQQGSRTTLGPQDTAVIPRYLGCQWKQSEGTRVFFMNYEGASKAIEGIEHLAVVTPNLSDELDSISGPAAELVLTRPLPKVGRKVIYTDPTGQFTVGLWEASAYTRKLAAFKDYEIMHFIEGQVEITNALDETRLFKARETFVVNQGVSNAWKTESYVRKVYCKLSPAV
jgi:uncharacterized cupin superfamily protein